ncbi:MAG TPA: biotin synthase BioB [Kiritimatiellia bacterium]|nr:biotin synthase BioB [Kiritimatiellia bacterium]HRZ11926.1 biotin synthase BioB [Kiritimatiellia bacterium]HSA17268.1 biotin synthase BioB [Kiritimatiellia bacterium]
MNWLDCGQRVKAGGALTREEALAVLQSSDDEILEVVQAAFLARRQHFGRDVNLHILRNAQSGLCGENCAFCSQSASSAAEIERYPLQSIEEIVAGALDAQRAGAVKYCVVTSGRAPAADTLDTFCEAARLIRRATSLHLCVSPGLLTEGQARRLAGAGVHRVNHNLETARRYFPAICTTHSYEDRVATVRAVKAAGMEACCGGILGLGETLEDRVDLAFALRELGVDSIPVNFFNPRPGTPLADQPPLGARDGLRGLAMFRLVNPTRDIRAAGGREACLGALQPLALYAANSIFTSGYLTTPGQGRPADIRMLEEAGFRPAKLEM